MTRFPSRLGFGVSGAHGTPLIARAQTLALIEAAFEGGVRVFDTAPAYGAGEAERRLGAAIARIGRAEMFISTKVGLSSSGLARRRRDWSPDAVEASVRASLGRLRIEGADLLLLHGASPTELSPALLERLDVLKRAGAFLHLGAAGRGAELDAAIAEPRISVVMAPVHAFLDETEEARLLRAARSGKRVIAIETAGDGPARLRAPRRFGDLYALAKTVRARAAGAAGRGRSEVPAGLAAALQRDCVACALFTTTRAPHLQQGLAAAGLQA